mmetsp:Transcript_28465/g.42225  ORF Transcript_28465/g.42225 Transcript_28465/m.42225 type:complete len:197 (-) Transcript_28465:148-738(-)
MNGHEMTLVRDSLNGKWLLDRNRGNPSVLGFLETMGVSPLAIEANEKGDADHDTIHDITLTQTNYTIKKLSRVNDMILDVTLGDEQVKPLLPGDRIKRTLATSEHLGHVLIVSSMPTMNGVARVTDEKHLLQETAMDGTPRSIYVQKLTIVNESTLTSNVTTRYFLPFEGEAAPTALTAGGNKKRERYYDKAQGKP